MWAALCLQHDVPPSSPLLALAYVKCCCFERHVNLLASTQCPYTIASCVAVVFWGGPVFQCYEALRIAICTVRIKSLRPATEAEIERMGGNCAICWGEMTREGAEPSAPAPTPPDAAAGDAAAAPAAEEAAVVEGAVLDAAVVAAAGGRSGAQSPADELAALLPEAPAEQASASAEGCSLPCGHSFHHACLSQVRGVGCTRPASAVGRWAQQFCTSVCIRGT